VIDFTLLAYYLLFAFGLAYVLGHSVISLPAREWLADVASIAPATRWLLALIECPACCGWWIGLFTGLGYWGAIDATAVGYAIGLAFVTTGSNFLLGRASGLMPLSPPG
jgi:hypothetical protein